MPHSGGHARPTGSLLIFGVYSGTVSVTATEGADMKGGLDLKRKLQILMSLAAGDRDGPPPPRLRNAGEVGALGPLNIRNLRPGPGMRMSLLRVLMTNACSFNCHYCPMRRDREMPRTLLKPDELVRIFLEARRRGWCEGLFITTGIPGRPVKVVDDLIQALELLRERHRFAGYIHVKLVPGAEDSQIERLTSLASRVSLNLEAPCGANLSRIAPEKSLPVTLGDLERVRALVLREHTARAGGFLTLRGRRLQSARWTEQLGFWAPEVEAGRYHLTYPVSPGTFR
jgi:predicted DNA-binding helix-hairpin-helix protein